MSIAVNFPEPSDDEDEDEEEDPMAPMITWKDFQRLMPWEIVILVGGGYALAAGCKVVHISTYSWISYYHNGC